MLLLKTKFNYNSNKLKPLLLICNNYCSSSSNTYKNSSNNNNNNNKFIVKSTLFSSNNNNNNKNNKMGDINNNDNNNIININGDNVANLRKDYKMGKLEEEDLLESPFKQFEKWISEEANDKNSSIVECNAFTLSTCSLDRKPSARIVLLKHYDDNGFVFYTNYNSRKSKELLENPYASLAFLWTQRQVRIEGSVIKVDRSESESYFQSRPRASQIGAWVSEFQSSEITKQQLLDKTTEIENKFNGIDVPCPPFWGGWRIVPTSFEFWQGKTGRIHDRIKYLPLDDNNNTWSRKRLSP